MEWYKILATVVGCVWGYALVAGFCRKWFTVFKWAEDDTVVVAWLWAFTLPYLLPGLFKARVKLPKAKVIK